MKKIILLLALCFCSASTIWAQTTEAKVDSAFIKLPLKEKLAGKTWYYNYSEKFHVRTKADSTQKQDVLILNQDMTYTLTENGKTSQGTWSVNESAKVLNMTNMLNKSTVSLKIASIIQDQMALRYMDDKLISYYKFYYTK